MTATWTVTYETATIQAGTAPTMEEADRIAANVHDSYVIKGLNPDALAWHVTQNADPFRYELRDVGGSWRSGTAVVRIDANGTETEIFCDIMEPEDATLSRDIKPLFEELKRVAALLAKAIAP